MAFTNFESKEIHCKVVYFGASQAGKTENLRSVYKNTADDTQAGLTELSPETRPTQYFDFLPLSVGHVAGYHIKLHLFALSIRKIFETVPGVLLKGLDGVIFVADSRMECAATNLEAFQEAKKLIEKEGFSLKKLPQVIQYNKRDHKTLLSTSALRYEINPHGFPEYEAVASESIGTLETLEAMTRQILLQLAPRPDF